MQPPTVLRCDCRSVLHQSMAASIEMEPTAVVVFPCSGPCSFLQHKHCRAALSQCPRGVPEGLQAVKLEGLPAKADISNLGSAIPGHQYISACQPQPGLHHFFAKSSIAARPGRPRTALNPVMPKPNSRTLRCTPGCIHSSCRQQLLLQRSVAHARQSKHAALRCDAMRCAAGPPAGYTLSHATCVQGPA
jgi:hypothetical protein